MIARKSLQPIEKRKVSRWFYNGKGYATETAAMKARAKDALREEILNGDVWRRTNELEKEWGSAYNEHGTSAYLVAVREAYRKKFPPLRDDPSWFSRRAWREWIDDHVKMQRETMRVMEVGR